MIDISYEILGLYVYPQKDELANVVGKVQLRTTFSRNGVSVDGRLDSILDTDNINHESFIAVEDLDADIVAGWAIAAQGGEEFLINLKNAHDSLLAEKEREVGLVKYH
jgi:hypothetical protein